MKRANVIGAALSLGAAGLIGTALAQDRTALAAHVLDNGVRVILLPSSGAPRVGVEAVYSVGFLDEPRGLTQATHLLEHLVCMCGTQAASKTSAPGEHWKWLTEHGMVNAETLGDFTHYDYEAPADQLPRLLEIERARLEGLQITPELIAQEIPRIYAETDHVESNPAAPLFKHALMAAAQSWNHGADRASVRAGLAEIPLERLREFHRATYRPERLTLVICGGFEPKNALALVAASLGAVKAPGPAPARPPIDWAALSQVARVGWDAKVSAVVLAFPPPQDAAERLAVNLMGDLLMARLAADPDVTRVSRSVLSTNQTWPAGALPVLVMATVKEGVTPQECAAVLGSRARALAAQAPSPGEMAMVSGMAGFIDTFAAPTWAQAQAQGRRLKAMGLQSPGDPAGLVLLNTALRGAVVERLVGADFPAAHRLGRWPAPELVRALTGALEAVRCRAVILEPA